MHIIRTAQVTRARVAGTQRQTKFQSITSAEKREGQGEAEDDEGRKDTPSVPPSTALARKKQNEEACGAPRKWWPYTCLQLNDSYAVDPLLAPRWTGRRRWTLRPLKRRLPRFPSWWRKTARKDGLHQTRLGRRPHDAPPDSSWAAPARRTERRSPRRRDPAGEAVPLPQPRPCSVQASQADLRHAHAVAIVLRLRQTLPVSC